MTILRIFERSESWPVAAKKVKNWVAVGIFILMVSGLDEKLIVKTTVKFLAHLVCPYI